MIDLRYNEAQVKLYRKARKQQSDGRPVRLIICKCRRAGLSTGVASLIYDDMTMVPNTWSLIVANQIKPSENVLSMYARFWRNTPPTWNVLGHEIPVRPPLPPQYREKPPRDEMIFDSPLDSRIFVATSKSLESYLSFGFQNIHATEAAHYEDADELFANLYPTLSTDSHSALYIESTAFGREGRGAWFFRECMNANSRGNPGYGDLELVFIPWHEMKLSFAIPFGSPEKQRAFEESMTVEEVETAQRYDCSLEQMAWWRMMLAGPTFNGNRDKFDEKYPSDLATAFLATGSSVFPRKVIKRGMESVRHPIWEGDIYWGESDDEQFTSSTYDLVRRPKFLTPGQARTMNRKSHVNERTYRNLLVWRWPDKGERLFLTADVGEGKAITKDGDWSVIYVGVMNDFGRDEILMRWRGHLHPLDYAELASTLAWGVRYMVGDSVVAPELIPEWTGPGRSMITEIDRKHLYPVYHYQMPGVQGMPKSRHLGWESNNKTKPIMVNAMTKAVFSDQIDIPDEEFWNEAASYRQMDPYGDENSFGGAAGTHDDCVTALSIFCAMCRIRAVAIPGESDVEEVDAMAVDDDDIPFDPFASETPIPGLPGVTYQDVDDENLEEALFWSTG